MTQSLRVGELQQLADQAAIQQLLASHTRGIDRCDAALLQSVYHPDAAVAYGFFDGPAHEFATMLTGQLQGGPVTSHRSSNQWIRTRGDAAVSESYVIAYMAVPEEGGGPAQTLVGGRYLDRFSRRGGLWKMDHRQYLLEWNINGSGSGTILPGFDSPMIRGGQAPDDPGQALLARWQSDHPLSSEGAKDMKPSDELLREVREALARQAIHDLIMTQARATDRRDAALLASVWHPDATVDVGVYQGAVSGYPEALFAATASLKKMFHSVANEWIRVSGDRAVAESYAIAFTTAPGASGDQDQLVGGRYLDRFECRGGQWKYSERVFVLDWLIDQPTTDASAEGMLAALTMGRPGPDDPVYALWESLA